MRLDGRRESSNVEDRRGMSDGFGASGGGAGINIIGLLLNLFLRSRNGGGGGKGSGCLLAIIIAGALLYLTVGGGDLNSMLTGQAPQQQVEQQGTYRGTAEEEELATFTKQILAGTEDVWTELFRNMGKEYIPPKLVMFTGAVQSGCGDATSAVGPFYCSADQTVYIDLSFFMNMKQQIGADGDFAYAYVIAHEVGHHVQFLLGDLQRIHNQMERSSETISNQLSVRLELQADFYAGIWAHHDNRLFNSLEDGDVEEGLAAAQKIGDDYLQKKARGYAVPESFNHGTSAQRSKWLRLGIRTGKVSNGDTFSPNYNAL